MSDDTSQPVSVEEWTLTTGDGISLRAEAAVPTPAEAVMVVCHPHPQYGGTMEANVVAALFRGLPPLGVAVVRFNFRGGPGSGGTHDHGQAERLDAVAAIETSAQRWDGVPLWLAGYSFGADVALAVDHPAITGWFGVAPPLRIVPVNELVALTDERPKHLVTGAHDQFRPPDEVAALVTEAAACTLSVADGADHFFAVGLTQVVEAARQTLNLGA